MRSIPALLLSLTLTASAAEGPWFPDQYKEPPCVAKEICQSFNTSQMSNAGARYLGLTNLDATWAAAHNAMMLEAAAPLCRKIGACYGTAGTTSGFCNDVVARDMRALCAQKFAKGTKDFEQCGAYIEVFTAGVDQYSRDAWRAAQACLLEKDPPVKKTVPPKWWMEPAAIPRGYDGNIYVIALDPETNLPVRGRIAIEKSTVWVRANPEGIPAPFYPWKWPAQFVRVPNAAGHSDVIAPLVTMSFDYYPDVTFRMPIEPPKMVVEMQPAKLRRGKKNTVTIKANDAETGAPVEARVMMGNRVLGDTNLPFELELKKGAKRGEIWLTSLFDAYSDVVVLPAEK